MSETNNFRVFILLFEIVNIISPSNGVLMGLIDLAKPACDIIASLLSSTVLKSALVAIIAIVVFSLGFCAVFSNFVSFRVSIKVGFL